MPQEAGDVAGGVESVSLNTQAMQCFARALASGHYEGGAMLTAVEGKQAIAAKRLEELQAALPGAHWTVLGPPSLGS
jgi:hypothetical protein